MWSGFSLCGCCQLACTDGTDVKANAGAVAALNASMELAQEMGVSKATLGYWLLKLGINVRRVALAPGETLEVKRVS